MGDRTDGGSASRTSRDADCAGETSCTWQQVNVEGVTALTHQESPPDAIFAQTAKTVPVTDGRLTIDAIGGDNTKLGYVAVALHDRVPIASFLASPFDRLRAGV